MRWHKKTLHLVGVALGMAAQACSGTSKVVGSDRSAAGTASVGSCGVRATRTSVVGEVLTPENLMGVTTACIPFALPENPAGDTTCQIASVEHSANCDCSAPGLEPASDELSQTTRNQLQIRGTCGPRAGQTPCSEMCVCTIVSATGSSLAQCLTQSAPNPSASGWCYVSAEQGETATALLSACAEGQAHELRFLGNAIPKADATLLVSCSAGDLPPPTATPAALGQPCVSIDETLPDFPGYDINSTHVDDDSAMCASLLCLQNRFQGRASCPYGQTAAGGGCLVAGSNAPVSVPVAPQLVRRPTSAASICSCQCAGYGPGPYCTCPDDMACDHLVDKIGTPSGQRDFSGSYCIPIGSLYDRAETTVCTAPNCGDAHPY